MGILIELRVPRGVITVMSFLRKKMIRIIKEVRYVSKIDVRHNAFVDTTTNLLTSLAQYKKNICCHHHFSLPTQQNCLLKFKLPSYGFSLSALKCTNLTKANTPNHTLNVERPKKIRSLQAMIC